MIDLTLVVDDLVDFHTKNLQMNKSSYPVSVRVMKKLALGFQKYGTKMHFNTLQLDDNQVSPMIQQ